MKQYTKKQITEAIAYWEKQIKVINESERSRALELKVFDKICEYVHPFNTVALAISNADAATLDAVCDEFKSSGGVYLKMSKDKAQDIYNKFVSRYTSNYTLKIEAAEFAQMMVEDTSIDDQYMQQLAKSGMSLIHAELVLIHTGNSAKCSDIYVVFNDKSGKPGVAGIECKTTEDTPLFTTSAVVDPDQLKWDTWDAFNYAPFKSFDPSKTSKEDIVKRLKDKQHDFVQIMEQNDGDSMRSWVTFPQKDIIDTVGNSLYFYRQLAKKLYQKLIVETEYALEHDEDKIFERIAEYAALTQKNVSLRPAILTTDCLTSMTSKQILDKIGGNITGKGTIRDTGIIKDYFQRKRLAPRSNYKPVYYIQMDDLTTGKTYLVTDEDPLKIRSQLGNGCGNIDDIWFGVHTQWRLKTDSRYPKKLYITCINQPVMTPEGLELVSLADDIFNFQNVRSENKLENAEAQRRIFVNVDLEQYDDKEDDEEDDDIDRDAWEDAYEQRRTDSYQSAMDRSH